MRSGSIWLRVSSTRMGSPKLLGVAPASTYCQRGVMTAVPNDTWLGLIRWTFTRSAPSYCGFLRTVSRVTSGTRFDVRCVLGETLYLLAPYRIGTSERALPGRDRKAGDLGEIRDSGVVEGSLG